MKMYSAETKATLLESTFEKEIKQKKKRGDLYFCGESDLHEHTLYAYNIRTRLDLLSLLCVQRALVIHMCIRISFLC